MVFLGFTISALVYIVVLLIVYFTKKRVNIFENKLLISIMFINVIGLILELGCYVVILNSSISSFVQLFVLKTYLVYIVTFNFVLNLYILLLTCKDYGNENFDIIKRFKRNLLLSIVPYLIIILLIYVLPLYIYNDHQFFYTYGPGVQIIFCVSALQIFLWLYRCFCSIIRAEHRNKQQFSILVSVILFGIIGSVTQFVDQRFLILTSMHSIVLTIMYFFIENPDVKMIEQLEIAKDTADKANNAKTDFLSSMSHEIRTPLNAIVGFSDCIKESTTLEEAKENAEDIISASNTLLEIVNGILDISKIEAGKLEIVNSNYDPKELFNGLAKLVTPKMKEKALDFKVSVADDLPNCLYGDHANIKKVVTNLLSNAYKYTESGFVNYEVNCVNKNNTCRLIISVEDSGRGIKKEDVDKLFTKFQRVDEDRNTTIEGTGLGLAITKQLVELMGGNIIVHTVYGEGSKFTITLDQNISNVEIEKEEEFDTIDLTNKTILVVDDNMLNLKVADKLLGSYNATVESANSGFECLDKIKSGNTYDLILLDDMMPKMSGTETFNKLKEIDNFKIPVVVLTANAIEGMKESYLKKGFDDYLSKPIEKEEMIRVFNRIFKNGTSNSGSKSLKKKKNLSEDIFNNKDFLEANGINVTHGIELLGDINMYNETMTEFLREIDNRLPKLEEYKNNSDMANYAIIVHAIKSDCKYLGIMSLADLSYQHEMRSKANDIEYINKNYEELISRIEDTIIICKKYLGIE